MAALIAGSSGLVGSYNYFNKLDKQSIKAINPENNMLFNETYYKEYNKRKFINVITLTRSYSCGRNFVLLNNL